MEKTLEQIAILEAIRKTDKNIQAMAVAGAGKSTLLRWAIQMLEDMGKQVMAVTFGKAASDQMAEKLKAMGLVSTSRTMHSIGNSIGRAHFGKKYRMKASKYADIVDNLATAWEQANEKRMSKTVRRDIVSVAEAWVTSEHKTPSMENVTAVAHSMGMIDDALIQHVYNAVTVGELFAQGGQWGFVDQIAQPGRMNLTVPSELVPEVMIVDEVQDLNYAQRMLLKQIEKSAGPRGLRVIAAGDPDQSIFGFAGAGENSFWEIQQLFDMEIMHLTESFRCPPEVTALARDYVDRITSHPSVIPGTVKNIKPEEIKGCIQDGALVLARKNSQILQLATEAIVNKIPINIRNQELADQINNIYWRATNGGAIPVFDMSNMIDDYERDQIVYLKTQNFPDAYIEEVCDLIECARCFWPLVSDQPNIRAVQDRVKELLRKNPDAKLDLSTIHKAKGDEHPRVIILGKLPYAPLTRALSDADIREERRLTYVAYTRAMQELYLVDQEEIPITHLLPEQQELQAPEWLGD